MRKLTPKQLLFVKEYPIDRNATKAAIRAGYSGKTARSQGQRLLTNVDIFEVIELELQKKLKKADVDAETVIERVRQIAYNEREGVSIRDQIVALTKLMEHLGLLKQRTVHENPDGTPLANDLAKVFARIPESGAIKFRQRHHN